MMITFIKDGRMLGDKHSAAKGDIDLLGKAEGTVMLFIARSA